MLFAISKLYTYIAISKWSDICSESRSGWRSAYKGDHTLYCIKRIFITLSQFKLNNHYYNCLITLWLGHFTLVSSIKLRVYIIVRVASKLRYLCFVIFQFDWFTKAAHSNLIFGIFPQFIARWFRYIFYFCCNNENWFTVYFVFEWHFSVSVEEKHHVSPHMR